MGSGATLEEIVFNVIHHNRKKVEPKDIAAATGTGYNHLMRMANPTDECNMPISKLVPIMLTTADFTILDWLAKQTGHLVVKAPHGIRKGTDPKMDISTYQKEFNELINLLIDFVNEPSDQNLQAVDDKMRKHIGDSVNIQRRCESHNMHQVELNL